MPPAAPSCPTFLCLRSWAENDTEAKRSTGHGPDRVGLQSHATSWQGREGGFRHCSSASWNLRTDAFLSDQNVPTVKTAGAVRMVEGTTLSRAGITPTITSRPHPGGHWIRGPCMQLLCCTNCYSKGDTNKRARGFLGKRPPSLPRQPPTRGQMFIKST